MARVIGAEAVESVTRILLGAIDAGDGGTAEQFAVLGAVVAGYWERPDLDLSSLSPIGPDAVAALGLEAPERRRVRQLMVMLELCRHPLTEEQVMLLGIDDSDDHWVLFLASLAAYELGFSSGPGFEAKVGALAREGAADMLAEALARGSHCTGDFSVVDHLELAHLPLDEVRARFGVPPLVGASS